MNLKTTLVLLVLLAGGVVFWFERTWLGEHFGLAPRETKAAHPDTLDVLSEQLTPEKLSRIEIQVPKEERPVVLERSAADVWTAPGQWPTRKNEVEQLVALLCGLRSRFVPIAITEEVSPTEYGLDKPAVAVKVKCGPTDYQLAFSEKAPPGEEESQETSRLNLPTFLRLDQRPEIVRLAPGLVAALSRPADYYQQRRLFTDVERVAKDIGDTQEKVEQLAASSLTIEEKKPAASTITLTKKGEEWELAQPVRDRIDPDKRKSLLQVVPDIWAEHFVAKPDKDLAKYGLKDPEQILRVVPAGSDKPIVLWIGSESPTKRTRTITRPAPPIGGMQRPPMTERIDEKFRYAKLENNDQIFEIKADKLKDVFVPAADLRDARVGRFDTKDVTRVELTHGSETIALAKVKEKDIDRWRMEKPTAGDAESSKITDILDKLTFLSARDRDVLDKSDPKIDGLDKPQATLAVTIEEEVKGEDGAKTKKPPRTLKWTIGRHDAEKKKLYIRDDWNRINVVDDNLQALVTRPAVAYRGRRIFDTLGTPIQTIHVSRPEQVILGLKKIQGHAGWERVGDLRNSAEEVDQTKADQLANDLKNLEAVEFVTETPKQEELETKYGLAKPALKVQLGFGNGQHPVALYVGKQRDGKPEYYAQSNQPAVFVIKKELVDKLDQDSLAYQSLVLWRISADDITTVRVGKDGQDEYRLMRKDKDWQIAGPFETAAFPQFVQPMTDELAAPRAEKCVAHAAKEKELEKYGLDKPLLRVTVTSKDAMASAKEHALLIGKRAEGPSSSHYAKLADTAAVYLVPEKFFAAVDKGALDLLDSELLSLNPKEVTEIWSNAGGNGFKLVRQPDGWKVVDSPAGMAFAADEQRVSDVLNTWAHSRVERTVAYDPKDLTKYGLDKPAWNTRVTVPHDQGPGQPPGTKGWTLNVGNLVENGGGQRYARFDKNTKVFILSAATLKNLGFTYLDYVDRSLLKFDAASATGLLRTGPEALEVVKKDDAWRLLKPADLQADERTMQGLFEQLASLRAERVAAYPAKDVKAFGLDQPATSVTIRLAGPDGKPSEKVLKIGKVADEKLTQGKPMDRFVQVEGSPVVGVLSGALADRLLAGPLAFRDRNLARFADADKAILKRVPREATFTKVDGTWKLTAPLEAEAEQTDMDDFINGLARLRADELVADKPADLKPYGLDKPVMQWRFFSGEKEVLDLLIGSQPPAKHGGKDARAYAKLANGDLVFLLNPPTTKRVLAEYRSKTLWPSSLDAAQVETLRYSGTGNGFTLEKSGDQWHVAGKASAQVNAAAVSDTLAALAGLKPERYVVDKGADLKLYGLEPPEVVIEAIAPSGRRVLHIGRAEGDSKRFYARVTEKDRTDVFVISEADAAKLVRPLAAFTQTTIKPAS
jgi:hypothetical protein